MQKEWTIEDKFDAVVMLTWSDWFTEPVSNRYHYATRFSRHLQVVFVQPDQDNNKYYFENTEFENIVVLHLPDKYTPEQGKMLEKALFIRKIWKPLLWVYNVFFAYFLETYAAPLCVYHATEDYLSLGKDYVRMIKPYIKRCLKKADVVVAVSEKVMGNYNRLRIRSYQSVVLENGVDYDFWHLQPEEINHITSQPAEKIAFFQGGVNIRLDYKLIKHMAVEKSDWEFWFCGRGGKEEEEFQQILKVCPNVRYFGELDIQEVRELGLKASVGIIPFKQRPEIYNSLPLKTFEYMALGLPIISVPIAGLRRYNDHISFEKDEAGFVNALDNVYRDRYSAESIHDKLKRAAERDYNLNFERLTDLLAKIPLREKQMIRKKVNILYDEGSMHVWTIKNYLEMFSRYSCNEIAYTPATGAAECNLEELENYDAVIIFYSVRVCVPGHLSPSFEEALSQYQGHKILMIQDDYDNTEETRKTIERLGIKTVYTVVPQPFVDKVYPQERFPDVDFFSIMTGYISDEMKNYPNRVPMSERKVMIGYRGRDIGYWYGNLAREKLEIGIKMKKICREKELCVDIEWEADKRIYSEDWLKWLSSCKATLGTESGSNIFDDTGELKRLVEEEQSKNPQVSYEEVFEKYLKPYEGIVKMNQISPKMFEAISLKVALILYEGEYSGILKPNVHYIPLKKDFSNIEEVLKTLEDNEYLQNLVDNAYENIMTDYKLSYQWLIEYIDVYIDSEFLRRQSENRDKKFHWGKYLKFLNH